MAELADQLARRAIALALEVDVADERSLAAAIAAAEEHFGQIDVLFNNAVGSRDYRSSTRQPIIGTRCSPSIFAASSSAASTVSRR